MPPVSQAVQWGNLIQSTVCSKERGRLAGSSVRVTSVRYARDFYKSDIRNQNRILDFKGHILQFLFNFKRITKGVDLG